MFEENMNEREKRLEGKSLEMEAETVGRKWNRSKNKAALSAASNQTPELMESKISHSAQGVYEVYRGQAAMDKAVFMTEYGLTMGELEDNRARYDVCRDTFYAVILNNQRLIRSPGDVREGGNSTLYLGFYLSELEMADLLNCNAAYYTQWTFQDKTR